MADNVMRVQGHSADGSVPLDSSAGGMLEGRASFSLANRTQRVAWGLAWSLLASWTPPPLHAWRCLILRLFGARVGRSVRIYGSTIVWHPANLTIENGAIIGPRVRLYNQGTISIGTGATISQGAHLCASSHDIADPQLQLVLRPIRVEAKAWIAADAFVGPGVTVEEGAVLAARGAAFHRLEAWAVYRGNPAQFLRNRCMPTPQA